MMYFREDAKRPMSVSREKFDSEWDRIFGKKEGDGTDQTNRTDGTDKIPICNACTRKCISFNVYSKECEPYFRDRGCRIVLAGFCSIKKGYIFELGEVLPFNAIYFDYENCVDENCDKDYKNVSDGCNQIICHENAKKKYKDYKI